MITDREDPSVFRTHRIGAVACDICKMVHIDMLDTEGNIVATASLYFPQWWEMVAQVGNAIEEIAINSAPAWSVR